MKKITAYLIIIIAMSSIGCKKFLDQQPIDQFSASFVFSTVEDSRKAIAGVYSQLTGDAGYGSRLSLYFTVDNDETQGPTGALNDNERRDMARYNLTSNNANVEQGFNQLFRGIEYANICIESIPQSSVYKNGSTKEVAQMRRMLGEALTLRAQFYFEALRNWGDLPDHLKSAAASASNNPFPARINRNIIYDRILDDLKTAATLLPWKNDVAAIGDDIDERITAGTAKALRARIALFRGGFSLRQNTKQMERSSDYLTYYTIARDECKAIMDKGQHSLNPSYRSLWKDQVCAHAITDPNGELMFQATGIASSSSAKSDTKIGYYNGPRVNGFGQAAINILPTYLYQFDSMDLRRDVTIAPYAVQIDGKSKTGSVLTAMVDGKYRRDWITNPTIAPTNPTNFLQLKWQIIRFSDVLLMFAEAENELNGPSAAYEAVNMVRRRGFGKPVSSPDATVDLPTGLGKPAFFDAIVRERSLELGGEGIRKYDLIRWNLLDEKITKTKNWLNALALASEPILPADLGPYGGLITLPKAMYYITNSTVDDRQIWVNSLYEAAPSSTPSGTTKKNWFVVSTSGQSDIIDVTLKNRYATAFEHNKSELMPLPQSAINSNINLLPQNPDY
jgi:hypothetical protein